MGLGRDPTGAFLPPVPDVGRPITGAAEQAVSAQGESEIGWNPEVSNHNILPHSRRQDDGIVLPAYPQAVGNGVKNVIYQKEEPNFVKTG